MREHELIVVGAGMAGASLAWRAAGRQNVLLLEREAQPGYLQSAAGASALADALLRDAALPDELRQHGANAAALSPTRLH